MRYDRDTSRRGPRSRADFAGRGEYGENYEGPYPRHGWSEGFPGGDTRSRASWSAGDRDEFGWSGGYLGGRGWGGTNYDLEHGYATFGQSLGARSPRHGLPREGPSVFPFPATRGGYPRGEAEVSEEYGPARYGYGPYFDRLRRRRRSDDDLRQEVEDTLFYDTWVDADAIAVSVGDGVVTLRGTLPSYDELRYAVDDAWNVDGVRGVRSEMTVREEELRLSSDAVSRRYEEGAAHTHGHPRAGEDESRETSEGSRGRVRRDARGAANAAGASTGRGRGSTAGRGRTGRRGGQPAGADQAAGSAVAGSDPQGTGTGHATPRATTPSASDGARAGAGDAAGEG